MENNTQLEASVSESSEDTQREHALGVPVVLYEGAEVKEVEEWQS
jgi:hypothetical protein